MQVFTRLCRLADIGLETFALSELFSSILIPGFFLLACILQLHYFHRPFMRITDLDHVSPIHRQGCTIQNVTHTLSDSHQQMEAYIKNKRLLAPGFKLLRRTKGKATIHLEFDQPGLSAVTVF